MVTSAFASFTDPYAYQAAIRAADVECILTRPGDFHAELTRIDMQHIWMQRGHQDLPCIARTAQDAKRSPIFFLTRSDEHGIVYNGRELAFGEIVFHEPEAIDHLQVSSSCHWGAISLTPDDLRAAGRSLTGRELQAPRNTTRMRPSKASFSRLLRLHRRACALARVTPQGLAHPETGRALENALTLALISCLTEQLTVKDSFGSSCHSTVMARFDKALAAEPKKPLYLGEICAAIGVSERTLRVCCREHLGMGPVRFLWLRRMHSARSALLRADPETESVTSIAVDHGFGELGRFSVAYRSLFGEPPSATLRGVHDLPAVQADSPFALAAVSA